MSTNNYSVIIDDVESIECVGNFEDEYVYDIEMCDASNHTFVANNVLVHNSVYVQLGDMVKSCDWGGNPVDFCLTLNEVKLKPYLKSCFDTYAAKFNTDNIQDLELEKVSHSDFIVSKKKYVLDVAWKEPNVFYESLSKLTPVGIEVVQSTTPRYIKDILMRIIKLIITRKKDLTYIEIVKTLTEIKKDFCLQNPNDISVTKGLNDYAKWILDDKKTISVVSKCPFHVKCAAWYNHIILNNPQYKTRYSLLTNADKVRMYYTKSGFDGMGAKSAFLGFGFMPNDFPVEFAPPIDYDMQFEKVVINPINNYLEALGMQAIPPNMVCSNSLF